MPPELNAASDRSLSVQVMVVVAAVLATKIFLLWVDLNELVFCLPSLPDRRITLCKP